MTESPTPGQTLLGCQPINGAPQGIGGVPKLSGKPIGTPATRGRIRWLIASRCPIRTRCAILVIFRTRETLTILARTVAGLPTCRMRVPLHIRVFDRLVVTVWVAVTIQIKNNGGLPHLAGLGAIGAILLTGYWRHDHKAYKEKHSERKKKLCLYQTTVSNHGGGSPSSKLSYNVLLVVRGIAAGFLLLGSSGCG